MNTMSDQFPPIDKEAEKWPRGELQQPICLIAPNKRQKKSSRSQLIDDFWSKVIKKVGPWREYPYGA